MKVAISLILFFTFYFVSLKDINDSKRFVEENNQILEYEMIEKDSTILALQRQYQLLKDSIKTINTIKPKKKPLIIKRVIADTLKTEIPDTATVKI